MIESAIASDHVYHFVFLELETGKDILELIDCLRGFSQGLDYVINQDDNGNVTYHIQVCLPYLLGTENVMMLNRSQLNESTSFWYDLYITQLEGKNGKITILAFPYVRLSDILSDALYNDRVLYIVHKFDLNTLLDYFRNRNTFGYKNLDDSYFVSISRYAATVSEDGQADGLELKGLDPVNSAIFHHIAKGNFKIATKFLKIKVKNSRDFENIEFSLDRLGNVSSWIKRDRPFTTLKKADQMFNFFEQIGATRETSYIRYMNLLEDGN